MLYLLLAAAFAFAGNPPSSQDILTRVQATTARRHAVEYAGERRYAMAYGQEIPFRLKTQEISSRLTVELT